MAEDDIPSNVTAPRKVQKRKRETPASRLAANKAARTSTASAYARRTPPPDPAPISDDEEDTRRKAPEPQLKRPGAGARIARERQQAIEDARRKREAEERGNVGRSGSGYQVVADHYNAVPDRGRQWRQTSQIKGLRSFNNWIKSTLIQKFSKPEVIHPHGMTVLDVACGKGGDLGKWEKAPVVPALYVGCDIADVSIDQARQRNAENIRRNSGRYGRPPRMQAEFYVQNAFARSLADIPIVNQVGFNPNAGPGPQIIQGGMATGGFDVVSMMFALHYSFESEVLARGMLKNVAGALKKGGKFIGVMPNSDVISATVKRLLQAEAPGQTPASKSRTPDTKADANGTKDDGEEDEWDPEKPSEPNDDDEWDPEKPSDPVPVPVTNGTTAAAADEDEDDWDPEKPSEPAAVPSALSPDQPPLNSTPAQPPASSTPATDPNQPPLEWGNKYYNVRFPRHQPLTQRPLPRDGIFRPPYGWKYHYTLEEAVDTPEYVVPWEGFRALAEDYGLELMYRKGFREVFEDESTDRELGMLAERMGVMSRDRSQGRGGLLVSEEEMEAAAFYHAFCFYKT